MVSDDEYSFSNGNHYLLFYVLRNLVRQKIHQLLNFHNYTITFCSFYSFIQCYETSQKLKQR